MAINYAAIRTNVAERLIRENGKVIQIITPGVPTGPDWDPVPGEPTEAPAYFLETGHEILYRDQSHVELGDRLGLVSTQTGAVPALEKTVRIDGTIYQTVNVQPLRPGTVTMLWKLHCRK